MKTHLIILASNIMSGTILTLRSNHAPHTDEVNLETACDESKLNERKTDIKTYARAPSTMDTASLLSGLRSASQVGASAKTVRITSTQAAGTAQATGEAGAIKIRSLADMLNATKNNNAASVLVCGYSPTGGGHTGRTFDVIRAAVGKGLLAKGSTVVLQIPEKWDGMRPSAAFDFAKEMKAAGINVFLAEADRSAYGFLDKKSGASLDNLIIDQFGKYPKRPADTQTPTTEELDAQATDLGDLQAVHAKAVMGAVTTVFDTAELKGRVRILTDMDPYLQKAADKAEIPKANRVDQQNHAIMLETEDSKRANNLDPRNAFLAKVLGGTGEKVSHIALGAKNTLGDIGLRFTAREGAIALEPTMKKAAVRQAVADLLMKKANAYIATGENETNPPFRSGVIHRPGLQAADVKNVVYIYANANTTRIADRIHQQVNGTAQKYPNTLFVVVGKTDMFKTNLKENPLRLAYIADADGITTSGAGTNGEFAYLREHGGSEASLLTLPIAGHNEQDKNADVLAKNYPAHVSAFPPRAEVNNGSHASAPTESERDAAVDNYLAGLEGENHLAAKYGEGKDMQTFHSAVTRPDTYVEQTVGLLFGAEMDAPTQKIQTIEQEMRNSPELETARHYIKAVNQAFRHVLDAIDKMPANSLVSEHLANKPLDIAFKQDTTKEGMQVKFGDWDKFAEAFSNQVNAAEEGKPRFNSEETWNASNTLLHGATETLFKALPGMKVAAAIDAIRKLSHKFGEEITTGF